MLTTARILFLKSAKIGQAAFAQWKIKKKTSTHTVRQIFLRICDCSTIKLNGFVCLLFYHCHCRKKSGQVVLDVLKRYPLEDVLAHIHRIASTFCMAAEDSGMCAISAVLTPSPPLPHILCLPPSTSLIYIYIIKFVSQILCMHAVRTFIPTYGAQKDIENILTICVYTVPI